MWHLWRRGATLQAPREHGLRVDDVGNNFVVRPVRATNNPQALGAVDVVPLAVKG
jgi:ketopantoate reductase